MSSSGTFVYSLDGGDLATEIWERLGKAPETMAGPQVRSLRRTINLMFADWANRGINLWTVSSYSVSATLSGTTLTMPVGSIDVLEMTTAVSGSESLMTPISRDEYVSIPVKSNGGRPTQYWVQRVLPLPIIHMFPTPDTSAYTLTVWRMCQMQDFTAGTENPDVPYLWYEALCAGASARLAVKFAPDRLAMLSGMAEGAFVRAAAENTEKVPMTITIDPTGRGRG